MANNPVLAKLDAPANGSRPSPAEPNATPQDLQRMFNQPAYGTGSTPPQTPGTGTTYAFGPPAGDRSRYMTIDDVVLRTGAMLGVLMVSGGLSWALASTQIAGALIVIGLIGGLGLGLYMSVTAKVNAVTALIYSAFEGLFLGGISRAFEAWKSGIVVQALTGTVMVAVGMLVAYKIGAIRVTPRLTRVLTGAMFGIVGLMLVNFIASLFHSGGLGLRGGGALAIVFSLVCIAVAALNLAVDFDLIEKSIRRGTDEKFAWYCSFGLMVTLVWLYIEILQLLGNLRD